MSDAKRLKKPLVAEIDLPPQPDLPLWRRRLAVLLEGGISVMNLVCNAPTTAVLDLVVSEGIDLAVTLPHMDWQPSSSWRRLAPCTMRLKADMHRPPDDHLRKRIAVLQDLGFTVVMMGELPPSKFRPYWTAWLQEASIAALNIEDVLSSSPERYGEFLKEVAEFSLQCPIPIISDLVLMPRFFPSASGVANVCPAGRLALFVSSRGEARPCRSARLQLGSLDTQDLAAIWNHPKLKRWTAMPEACRPCNLEACRGGCLARRNSTGRDRRCPGPLRMNATVTTDTGPVSD